MAGRRRWCGAAEPVGPLLSHPLRKVGFDTGRRDQPARTRPERLERLEKGPSVERDKALDVALSQIEKHFGKGSIMRMGENLHMQIEAIPQVALVLDLALGIGGPS